MAVTFGIKGTSSGVPVGTHNTGFWNSTSGMPLENTLVLKVTNADTQGPFPLGGGGKTQPATTQGLAKESETWPYTVTLGLGRAVGTVPPWEQVNLVWARHPGI